MSIAPWSFSKIKSFEQCPKKFYHLTVLPYTWPLKNISGMVPHYLRSTITVKMYLMY